MSLDVRCQVCARTDFHWKVRQAEINIGALHYYTLQMCEECTLRVQQAIVAALSAAVGSESKAESDRRNGVA